MSVEGNGNYTYGTHYWRPPTPPREQHREHLARIRNEFGFNLVKIRLLWNWHHRKPDAFQFDEVHELFDICDELGLDVLLEVNLETAPYWLEQQYPDSKKEISDVLYSLTKEVIRARILKDGVRPDGRSLTEIRPIWCEVGLLARTHGSAVFTRGQTQVMTIATLGPITEQQKLEGITTDEFKRYMHHYNMLPYSVGEAKPMRSPGRREIGHGALAATLDYLGVNQDEAFGARDIDNDYPQRFAYLRRGLSRPPRVSTHRLQHILDELLNRAVDGADLSGLLS